MPNPANLVHTLGMLCAGAAAGASVQKMRRPVHDYTQCRFLLDGLTNESPTHISGFFENMSLGPRRKRAGIRSIVHEFDGAGCAEAWCNVEVRDLPIRTDTCSDQAPKAA